MDLRHAIVSTGCRRLWALVRGLPVDAAVHRDGKLWSQADELAAVAIERADVWGWRLTHATGRFRKVPEMPPIKHPARRKPEPVEPAERRMSTMDEISSFVRKLGGEVKSG